MTSKKCCCGRECEWCNHDQNANDPRIRQSNYKEVTGTITTEIPSVGHPVLNVDYNNAVYTYYGVPHKSYLRTPAPASSDWNKQTGWGTGVLYGDIQPCWFNGINMKNVTDDNAFHEFKFILRIRKKINNNPTDSEIDINSPDYEDVVNISWNGYGRNIRPHPDTCGSYNITSPLFLTADNGCGIFASIDENGNSPCEIDFAKMPRGPWPYRLKRNLQPDYQSDYCWSRNAEGDRISPLTADQAVKYNETAPENQKCPVTEQSCQFSGDPENPYASCCQGTSDIFCSSSEFCNMLDEEGTPYGWEDCPYTCLGFSKYNKTPDTLDNLRFFCWWNPYNRYTTPEWDVLDKNIQSSRKLSIHVIVPTTKSGVDFCEYHNHGTDVGFGEWSFGMDLEAPGEIETLENSGFIFSNGREKKGVWINKTPTNALRVLFTLDHVDLEPGKVWRVFNDWDVKSDTITWDKNANSGKEFIVYVEQQLIEKAFSSIGCDCPSGGTAQGLQACAYPVDPIYSDCVGTERISFAERGPLAVRLYADTQESGAYDCLHDVTPADSNATKISSKTCADYGTILIVDGRSITPSFAETGSYYPNIHTSAGTNPFLDKTADLPASKGLIFGASVDFVRYRSIYSVVEAFVEKEPYESGAPDLYGHFECSGGLSIDINLGCVPYSRYSRYAYGPITLTPFITSSYIRKCSGFKLCNEEGCVNDVSLGPKEDMCVDNIVSSTNLPSSPSIDESCEFIPCRAQGTMEGMCSIQSIDAGSGGIFGIDADGIYFRANASEDTVGSLGNKDCRPHCSGAAQCHPGSCNSEGCGGCGNYREQGGKAYGAGFPDTFIKWRRYYCQKTDIDGNANTSLLPVDLMGKLYLECDSNDTCILTPDTFSPSCYFFKYGDCFHQNNGPEIYSFGDSSVTNGRIYGKYIVYTKPYNISIENPIHMGYWDTNYKPNEFVDKQIRRSGNTITITQQKKIT